MPLAHSGSLRLALECVFVVVVSFLVIHVLPQLGVQQEKFSQVNTIVRTCNIHVFKKKRNRWHSVPV